MDSKLTATELDRYRRIAFYYYKEGMTQKEVAERMNLTRQTVNKVLQECIRLGVTVVHIDGLDQTMYELERSIEHRFGLKEVRIACADKGADPVVLVGKLAAKYVDFMLMDQDIIGCSRGKYMNSFADHFQSQEGRKLNFVQLMGGWNNLGVGADVDSITHRLAYNSGGISTSIHSPVIVNHPKLKNYIMKEPYFQETYELVKTCTVAIVGIGEMKTDGFLGQLIKTMKPNQGDQHKLKQAVGEICSHFYDINGKAVKSGFEQHVVAVDREDYLNIPVRLGIAGGREKTAAVLGAIKGQYVNYLIIDRVLAEAIMEN